MELTNYWWLLIWIFAAGGIMAVVIPKQKELVCGKMEYRWGWLPALGVALPYIIWATFRGDFTDTVVYADAFKNVPASLTQLPSYLSGHTKDKGFSIFMVLFKNFFGDSTTLFFFAIAVIQLLCIVAIYRKYSSNYWISMFLFIVSTDYLSWMHNGIRQFLAVTMIFAGFGLLLKKKYIPLICLILLASTIHGSALIMLPVVFIMQGKALNKKTVLFSVIIVVAILFLDKLTPVVNNMLAETQYSDMMTNEIWSKDDGTSFLRILVYSVPAILAIIGKKYVNDADDPVVNLSVNASILSAIWYVAAGFSSGIYVGRLPIYVSLGSYIAMPWLIDNMFTKSSARLVKMAMISGYLVFFYFQMHVAWNLI